jgi:hypothetical protein
MTDLILNICFFAGVLLLIVCILLLRSSQRKKFDNTPQIIQIWGLKLEVSILTLVFLISIGLIATNIWFQLQRINERIEELTNARNRAEKEASEAKDALAKATFKDAVAFVSLPQGTDVSKMRLDSLTCRFKTKGGTQGEAHVEKGNSTQTLQITFKNVGLETIIDYVELIQTDDKTGGTIWSANEEFQPLKAHTFQLTKVTGP